MVDRRTKKQKKLPKKTQAERIIEKFGGVYALAKMLKECDPNTALVPSSIYRWTYSKEKLGTGGIVPTAAIPAIIKAARMNGIYLHVNDFFPDKL